MQTCRYHPKLFGRILALCCPSDTYDPKTATALQPHSTLASLSRHQTSLDTHHHSKMEKMSKRVTRSETKHRQQQKTVIPDPSKPHADGTCFSWNIPRELRVKVLKDAYGRDRDAPVKPIMGVDYLRDELGFVTTDRRRDKLPRLVSWQYTVYSVIHLIATRFTS